MPAIQPLIAGSIVNVTIRTELFGQRIMNLFQYYPIGTIDPDVEYVEYLSNLGTNLQALDGLIDKWSACVPSTITDIVLRLQVIYPARLRYLDQNVAVTGGTGAGITTNLAASVTRRSWLPGRVGVGRVQIPISPELVVGGMIEPGGALFADLEALAAEMLNPVPDPALTVTWQPVLSTGDPITPQHALMSADAQDTARVMRRRTVRLGE